MVVGQRGSARGLLPRVGRGLLLVAALVLLAGLGARMLAPAPAPPGRLLDVGGQRLHLDCRGAAARRPAVVIEAGAGMSSLSYHALQHSLVGAGLRVCRYDRAGLGVSDGRRGALGAERASAELRALLRAGDLTPPYVMVGHSMGGLLVRHYARVHPDEVAALVLIDPSHPQQQQRLQLPPPPTMALRVLAALADLGLVALYDRAAGWAVPPGLPQREHAVVSGMLRDGRIFRAAAHEYEAMPALARATPVEGLGDLPLLVLTADATLARFGTELGGMHRELAESSSRGRQRVIMGSDHHSIVQAPRHTARVAAEIVELLGDADPALVRSP